MKDEFKGLLSVIMPAYNEESSIEACLLRVLQQPSVKEVIVIDDGSTDHTSAIVESIIQKHPNVCIKRHLQNKGKGAALRTGFAFATGDVVLVQDADLEYDPAEYEKVLLPILQGKADIVIGSRFSAAGGGHGNNYWQWSGNKILTRFSNYFSGLRLTDMECGMKLFSRQVLMRLNLKEPRFSIEPEIIMKAAAMGVKVCEIPISYSARSYAEGKKIKWSDGFHALWAIVKYGVARRLASWRDLCAKRAGSQEITAAAPPS